MSEKRTPTPIAEWIYPIITDGVARYPNCQEREDNDESACALSAKVRWRGRDLCRRHASTLALIEAVSGRDTNATLTIDINTLRAANEGLRDSYLEQVRVNKALVADVERYHRIRAARRYVGMLEFAVAHADTDEQYDEGVDGLPQVKP